MGKLSLLLYSDIVAVDGEEAGAIYCLDKGILIRIPLSFCAVIADLQNAGYEDVKLKYKENSNVFKSYVEFLLKHKLAYFTTSADNFPKRSLQYDSPEVIAVATIAFSTAYNFEQLIAELIACDCKHLRIFLLNRFSDFKYLFVLLEATAKSTFRTIDIVADKEILLKKSEFEWISRTYKKVTSITFCRAGLKQISDTYELKLIVLAEPFEEIIKRKLENYVVINSRFFYESQNACPFYNKKVYVDSDGNIKNSIHLKKVFGNVKQDKLLDIVETAKFQRRWKYIPPAIRKSEFRYCLYTSGVKVDASQFVNCNIKSFEPNLSE